MSYFNYFSRYLPDFAVSAMVYVMVSVTMSVMNQFVDFCKSIFDSIDVLLGIIEEDNEVRNDINDSNIDSHNSHVSYNSQ